MMDNNLNNAKALINFYARLVRKDQMKIDEIPQELRVPVKNKIAELNETDPLPVSNPEE